MGCKHRCSIRPGYVRLRQVLRGLYIKVRWFSKLLHAANQDAKAGEAPYKDKLKKFARVLLNGTEISAQEASAFLLGIPNTSCSRQDVFINTAPPEERIGMLKTQEELIKLADDDEDICVKGIIERYPYRPEEMEEVCLAQFASKYEFTKSPGKAVSAKPSDDTMDHSMVETGNMV